jgi:geranylgeranylglycerol-phosphate geranylgeranyltransferase
MLRPLNAAMAAAGTVVGLLVARAGPLPLQTWIAAPSAAFLVAAYGNVLNDRRDAAIDRSAHPDRPLPSGRVSPDEAVAMSVLLAVAGVGAADLAGLPALALAIGSLLLLHVYESSLKARGLPGNLLVAYLVASTVLFGAAATGQPPAAWGMAWPVAAMAFLANAGRELLKDLEDAGADAGHRWTFPMRRGAVATRMLAFGLVAVAVALSLRPILARPPGWSAAGLAGLAPADMLLLAGGVLARFHLGYAQRLLKAGMALALVAFAVAAWP